jgi:hypothetical protein
MTMGLAQAHRQLRLLFIHASPSIPPDNKRDIPSHLHFPVSTSESYYSPMAIAVARTLLTKIQSSTQRHLDAVQVAQAEDPPGTRTR